MQETTQATSTAELNAEMDRVLEDTKVTTETAAVVPAKLTAAEAIAKYAGRTNEFRDKADLIKAGDYVPVVILVVQGGQKVMNYHLPQQLFALKDFSQADVLLEYTLEHPFQMPMLNPQNPDPAMFNCAASNFHKWLVKKGYCEVRGANGLTVHIWTEDEIKAAQADEKAKREAALAEVAKLNHTDEVAFTQEPSVGSIGSDPQYDPKVGRGRLTPIIEFPDETPAAPVVDINNIDAVGGKSE